jgi:cytochrome c553
VRSTQGFKIRLAARSRRGWYGAKTLCHEGSKQWVILSERGKSKFSETAKPAFSHARDWNHAQLGGGCIRNFGRLAAAALLTRLPRARVMCCTLSAMNRCVFVFATALLGSCTLVLSGQESVPPPVFTSAQAEAGRAAYERSCGMCHTYAVSGRSGKAGELPSLASLPEPYQKFIGPRKWVPALMGKHFVDTYGQKTLRDLFVLFRGAADTTPVSELNMSDETLVDITAYILQKNGAKEGAQPLTAQSSMRFQSVVK